MTRKLVFLMSLTPEDAEEIRQIAPGWEIAAGRVQDLPVSQLKEAEVVVGWHSLVEEHCFEADAKLRWVQSWGAGVDGYPFAKFADKGAVLTCARGVHPFPISESVYAMMLGLTRRVHYSIRNQLQRKWQREEGSEMHGKTVGIVGVGAIGTEIAKIAKVFGMRVLGIKRNPTPVANVDALYKPEDLNKMVAECDYIVNALPLTKETAKMFGPAQFAAMKPTAFYISIGRGGTTDTDAVYEALRTRAIAGAGLDVFDPEPLPADHPLWALDNVIITAHNANSTIHYGERAMDIFKENLRSYVRSGTPAMNVVDLKAGY
ncbi:D-2-hydroxyacid dehydrogenase [Xylanibacillus composti]|uniref:2-hydroxyacid dehydrogenase n=1 Tax=Xylanibacillus composti TaxID=1572762 RepID=A0A8J4H542_9BACL|nr:D-2-hydroxyacid dehydrogenase [Xylanibacillus composti]MDT9725714.1 D-2-hydroxyacid dehydrogenase [Xylanibacillus composti]GIQ71147.1 2-hydroxyacid dehydrogenase [Xylanibacillus composti]